jgi:hypothetical protein
VAPLNVVPGAVVSLMDRSNVETVIVAGKVLKWKGHLLNVNLSRLRRQLEDSRDFLFEEVYRGICSGRTRWVRVESMNDDR